MGFEYNKLRGRIIEKYGTLKAFADDLDISYVAVSKKMNGLTGFSQKDIIIWCEKLDINISDAPLFFLNRS